MKTGIHITISARSIIPCCGTSCALIGIAKANINKSEGKANVIIFLWVNLQIRNSNKTAITVTMIENIINRKIGLLNKAAISFTSDLYYLFDEA
jgi:hypothetical protein